MAAGGAADAVSAKRAVAVTFAANGLAFGSWASRTPAVKADLHLDASGLGLLLICISIGSLTALPLSGPLVQRIGPGRAVLSSAAAEASGFVIAALGLSAGRVGIVGAGLALAGLGVGTWDVAMNVEGAAVERRLGRTVMSRFHAAWSLGSVAGAGVGAAFAARDVTVSAQLVMTAVVLAILAVVGVSRYPTFQPRTQPLALRQDGARTSVAAVWRNGRTLLVGVMVLAFAFTEGVANDWMAVAVVDGLGSSDAVGAIAFGCFVAAMTLARLIGGTGLDRWGRVAVLRSSACVAAVGLLLVIASPVLVLVLAGALLWGAGSALGFPTGVSAAADDVPRAALHVSVVSSIGYTAFLAGPPIVGFLGDAYGIRHGLYVVLVALALALATSAWARPPSSETG